MGTPCKPAFTRTLIVVIVIARRQVAKWAITVRIDRLGIETENDHGVPECLKQVSIVMNAVRPRVGYRENREKFAAQVT
jgi:hypothetical protein